MAVCDGWGQMFICPSSCSIQVGVREAVKGPQRGTAKQPVQACTMLPHCSSLMKHRIQNWNLDFLQWINAIMREYSTCYLAGVSLAYNTKYLISYVDFSVSPLSINMIKYQDNQFISQFILAHGIRGAVHSLLVLWEHSTSCQSTWQRRAVHFVTTWKWKRQKGDDIPMSFQGHMPSDPTSFH